MMAGIIILALFFLAPFLVGLACIRHLKVLDREGLCAVYITGFIGMLGIFEILCVPLAFMQGKLSILAWIYGTIVAVICLYAGVWERKELKRRLRISRNEIKRLLSVAAAAAFILIMFQTFVSVYYTTYAALDDAGYIVYSLDTVDTDLIYGCSPYTGTGAFHEYKMLFNSWCIFISFLSRISGIHVAVIAHTILPFILVPLAYGAYYLLGKKLCGKNRKKTALFMLFLNIVLIFSAYSRYSPSLRLNVSIWHGKAVLAVIILPFLFYYLMKQKYFGWQEYCFLIVVFCAGCSMTLMACGLFPLMFLGMLIANGKIRLKKSNLLCCFLFLAVMVIIAVAYIRHYSFGTFFEIGTIKNEIGKAYEMAFASIGVYWNKSWMALVTAVCFAYLCVTQKKGTVKNVLLKYMGIVLVLIYNPFFVYIAYVYLKQANSFVRVAYVLPILYVVAYAFMDIVSRINGKGWGKRIAAVSVTVFLSGTVVLAGENFYNSRYFQKTENLYKIPQEVLAIVNAMKIYDERIHVVGTNEILPFLRQYDSDVKLLYGRNGAGKTDGPEMMASFDNGAKTAEVIRNSMIAHECNFVIFCNGDDRAQRLLEMGGTLVGETEHYIVVYFADS